MMSMNTPMYAAFATHSTDRPVLVSVSTRCKTRFTAMHLIAYATADENPGLSLNANVHAGSGPQTFADKDDNFKDFGG